MFRSSTQSPWGGISGKPKSGFRSVSPAMLADKKKTVWTTRALALESPHVVSSLFHRCVCFFLETRSTTHVTRPFATGTPSHSSSISFVRSTFGRIVRLKHQSIAKSLSCCFCGFDGRGVVVHSHNGWGYRMPFRLDPGDRSGFT